MRLLPASATQRLPLLSTATAVGALNPVLRAVPGPWANVEYMSLCPITLFAKSPLVRPDEFCQPSTRLLNVSAT